MAYTSPPTWHHGDFPTATPFNALKDSLDAVYAQTGSAEVNPAVCYRQETVQGFYFVHKHPYLIYLGAGRIEDPAGVEEDVSLSGESGWAQYDLSTVAWLVPGKVYQVEGVSSCLEDGSSL